MKTKAEDQLTTARKGAMESKHNYDMVKMSLEQEIKNLKSQLASATQTKAATGEALGKANGDLAGVEKSKAADEEYLSTTKMDCEATASAWAARQKDSDAETAAIEKAKEILAKMSIKFHSFALTQLASRASADPFAKIKSMISETDMCSCTFLTS